MAETTYSIGEVVRLLSPDCDVTESTLRFWEKMGLISSRRTPGGHRVFTEEDLSRIRIIKRLQTQRYMPLSKIRKLCQSVESVEELAAIAEFNEHFYRPLRYDPSFEPLTRQALAARTGLSPQAIEALEHAGALHPVMVECGPQAGEPCFDEDGLRVAEIFHELSRFGVEPEDLQETCEMTVRLIELQYRYYYDKLAPRIPTHQQASQVKILSDLGQELVRIIYHQTYLSVGERLTREVGGVPADAKTTEKAKNS
ncbi:HTH-type transcriptional repressor YcgE [compost metagenome]